MTVTQMAQQVLTNLNQQSPQVVQLKPKPIFVMKVPASMSAAELKDVREALSKDSITDDYHVVVVANSDTDFQFEMYNADKIEKQSWNTLVNKILK